MTRQFYILLLVVILSSVGVKAQQAPIMVCNPAGTSCTPYYNLDTAYNNAAAGDYIYLPGGAFSFNDTIDKEIHIIGAGIAPDSSLATGITVIGNTMHINSGGSNSSFEGVFVNGDIKNVAGNLNNITIKRCRIKNLECVPETRINNSLFLQSIFSYLDLGNQSTLTTSRLGSNNLINNCILSYARFMTSSLVSNCIFIDITEVWASGNFYHFQDIQNTNIKNSVLFAGVGHNGYSPYYPSMGISINNCILKRTNLFGGGGIDYTNAFINITNVFYNQSDTATFVNAQFDGAFSWSNNYAVLSTSPAHNGGDDGTDMGIYGGSTPWVDGAVPSNPHIYFKNISGSTNSNGDLPVEIKVRSGN